MESLFIWSIINIVLFLIFGGLGIYVLILLIKALKIYIKKNS
ncbi:hypothetical protein QTI80_03900 [Clostridium perfringens]|nr:hypothetical protein [Clostridium perfringens]MDM0930908.1 hypothetical protein [Clostridium perfringens]